MVIDIGALKIALKRTMLGLVVIGLKDLGKKSFPETARANNKGKVERQGFLRNSSKSVIPEGGSGQRVSFS